MKVFTTHLRQGEVPVLVREGFSIGAALLGWLWLLWQRAWIPAALVFAIDLVAARLTTPPWGAAVLLGLLLLQGLLGRDLVRWSLARRGFAQGPVVAAQDEDAALARLLTERAELLEGLDRARLANAAA
ncbi:MAG: DUF2628 domain-containing protein [Rhodospirillales bacterium]